MQDLLARVRIFSIQILSVLIDSLFLVAWVLTNWAADKYVFASFHLQGLNTLIMPILETAFAFSTLFPVLVFITVDLLSIFMKARLSVQKLRGQEATAQTAMLRQGVNEELQ